MNARRWPRGRTAAELMAMYSDETPPSLTSVEAAGLVGVSLTTLYRWSAAGLLKGCARIVGGRLRIDRQELVRRLMAGKLRKSRKHSARRNSAARRKA